MTNWVNAEIPPDKCDFVHKYLVTVEYIGEGNINNRKTLVMTYEYKGRNKTPTWCWGNRKAPWKVLFWTELPEPCQDFVGVEGERL